MTLWLLNTVQALLLIALAPLGAAVLKKMKARLQNRSGPGLFQSYRDLRKLFGKEPILPEGASWIFRLAPYIIFASTALACAIVPVLLVQTPLSAAADVITLVGLFALARFFTALGAMDTGTAFGGMGASREMTFAALAEPAMLMSVFVVSMAAESTNLSTMIDHMLNGHFGLRPSLAFALVALLLVAVAETGRIPVDNPSTHLELTMVHEAMILEYSGRYLGLIEWANHMKLLLFMTLLLNLFCPWGIAEENTVPALLFSGGLLALKILFLQGILALMETWMAKMRIFRLPEYLGTAFLIAILGMLTHYILEGSA
ncbi:MAG: formate hydrogenlyase [Candidatus Nitronauta litoralis]|uniref:Formate hydrogenlyase n=1 Tax=Candidatus Nitronauta litoralis TaxID=2705533 RepID=A0A7T0BW10_9BACT|nr:MAG: formate hydrogenlyase [Candidatus Nitronauta litoralis]